MKESPGQLGGGQSPSNVVLNGGRRFLFGRKDKTHNLSGCHGTCVVKAQLKPHSQNPKNTHTRARGCYETHCARSAGVQVRYFTIRAMSFMLRAIQRTELVQAVLHIYNSCMRGQ